MGEILFSRAAAELSVVGLVGCVAAGGCVSQQGCMRSTVSIHPQLAPGGNDLYSTSHSSPQSTSVQSFMIDEYSDLQYVTVVCI